MVEKSTTLIGQTVNSQITDAITQTNAIAVGIAPAQSMATLYQTMSQSTGAAMQNAVANQQNLYSLNLASLSQNLQAMMGSGAAANAQSVRSINSSRGAALDAELLGLLTDLIGYHAEQKINNSAKNARQTAAGSTVSG